MQDSIISYESNDIPSGIARYWLQRARLQPETSSPKSTRYGLHRRNHGQFLISDSHEMTSDSSWWTESQHECQVYYDLDNAFRCAGILASITNEDIEVVKLD